MEKSSKIQNPIKEYIVIYWLFYQKSWIILFDQFGELKITSSEYMYTTSN